MNAGIKIAPIALSRENVELRSKKVFSFMIFQYKLQNISLKDYVLNIVDFRILLSESYNKIFTIIV